MRTVFSALASMLLITSPIAMGAGENAEIQVLIAERSDAAGKALAGVSPSVERIVQLLAAESGLNLVARAYPWRRAQMIAESGKGLLYGAAATPERQLIFDFSKPLYTVSQWLVTDSARAFDYQGWDDLRGKTISINGGSKFSPAFEERKNVLFTVAENANSIAGRMNMLSLGRVDVAMIDNYRLAGKFEERLNCVYGHVGKFAVLPKPLSTEPLLIAVPKTAVPRDTVRLLNNAIDRLERSRAVQSILDEQAAHNGC